MSAQIGRIATFTLLALASLTVMANATIAPSLPALRDHFANVPGIDATVGLVMTLPSLAVALLAAGMGALSDRIGRRPVLFAGLVAYAVGGSSGLFVDGLTAILAGRILLGIGLAAVMTTVSALAGDLFTGPARERFLGLQAASMSAGAVVILSSGGFLADLHWRLPFALYLTALPLLALAVAKLPPTPPPARHDGTEPVDVPWARVALICGLAAFGMIVFYVFPVRIPFLLRELGHDRPSLAGAILAVTTLTSAVSAMNFGRIRGRLSPLRILAVAYAVMAVGYAVVGLAWSPWGVAAGSAVAGLGLGLTMPASMGWLMASVPAASRGRSAGLMTTAIFFGQFVSPLLSGLIASSVGLASLFELAALALLVVGVGCAVLTLPSPGRPSTA